MDFETNNLDLAAYLKLRGVEPIKVELNRNGFRRFTYEAKAAKPVAAAFWDDHAAPIRSFALARAALKKYKPQAPTTEEAPHGCI